MASNEEIKVVVGAETGQFKAGMADASRTTKATGKEMEESLAQAAKGIQNQLQSMGNMLRNVFAGFTIGTVAQQVVSVMSSFENLEIRLRSVMGSVEKGDEAFAWIKKFAKDTPFEVDGVTNAFMLLKNMGLDPMDGTMQAISDTAAKSGQGLQGLERISLALGQAFTKGKLQGEEMNQLLEAGVPGWDLLAKATGKSTQELQKMAEKGQLGRDAIKALIEEMGRASAGGAGAMMASLDGQISNFTDNVKNALDDLRKNGGLDFLKEALGSINAKFDELNANGSIQAWASTAGQAMNAFGESFMSIAGTVLETVGELASMVVSGFTEIGRAFTSLFGGEAISGMEFFRNTLKLVEIAIVGLQTGFKILLEVVSDIIERIVINLLRFGDAASRALKLDFGGAKKAWEEGGKALEEAHQARMDNIVRISQEAKDKIDGIIMRAPKEPTKPTQSAAPGGQDGPRRSVSFNAPTGDANSMMSKWEAELAKMRVASDSFREFEKSRELAFWQEKLRMTKAGSDERVAVERKIADTTWRIKREAFDLELAGLRAQEAAAQNNAAKRMAVVEQEVAAVERAYGRESMQFAAAEQRRVQAARQAEAQIREIKQLARDTDEARQLAGVESAATAARLDLDTRRITQLEALALESQFEEQRFAIKLKGMQDRLALMDPDSDPVAYAAMKAQIQQAEIDHQTRMGAIRAQFTAEKDGAGTAIFDQMERSFEGAITGIITRAQTLRQALTGIFKSIFSVFVTEMVSKPLAMAAMRFIRESILGKLFFAEQTGMQAAAAAKTIALKEGETAAVVGMEATKAAAGGAAAVAGIPIIGPALAVGAAAAMLALVMGLGGGSKTSTTTTRIPSAANGYDIPAGLNPLTQLHEREMVLPQEQADVIRNMAGGGGGGQPIQVNITAMDSRDVKRFLLDNKSAVADALKSAVRDFQR